MNYLENISGQYVLKSMDILKVQSLHIQNFVTREIFPITLDEYPILCSPSKILQTTNP
jgi:hypothetical protein